MAFCVTIFDETLSGERTASLRLDLLSSTITARELIRRRVYEEVQEYHAAPPSSVAWSRRPILRPRSTAPNLPIPSSGAWTGRPNMSGPCRHSPATVSSSSSATARWKTWMKNWN